jgi:hypothetical protein
MTLIKEKTAIEIGPTPFEELVIAGLKSKEMASLSFGDQGRIGGEDNPFVFRELVVG